MANDHFALDLITAPSAEPFSTAEAKEHLRVDESADDDLIDLLITAVRERFENDTSRALSTQTWEMYLDEFPDSYSAGIVLAKAPVQSITSIKYIDDDGDEQTWDSSKYRVDLKSTPPRITPAYDESWPSARCVTNAITIKFVAGYGDAADIPENINQALKTLMGHWYENRETIIIGTSAAPVPQTYDWLMAPHRVLRF